MEAMIFTVAISILAMAPLAMSLYAFDRVLRAENTEDGTRQTVTIFIGIIIAISLCALGSMYEKYDFLIADAVIFAVYVFNTAFGKKK